MRDARIRFAAGVTTLIPRRFSKAFAKESSIVDLSI